MQGAIKRDLVDFESLTGRTQSCVLIDGTVRKFPVATVFVETPYYTGEIEVLCAEYPVYDLIIGNVSGVRDPKEVLADTGKSNDDLVKECDIGLTVQTRAQKAKENVVTKVKVADPISGVGVEEFKKAQQEDRTLDKAREKVKVGENVDRKKGAKVWFGLKK